MKKFVVLILMLVLLLSTVASAQTKYNANENYNILRITFPEFIDRVQQYDVPDRDISSFLNDLNEKLDADEKLTSGNFRSRMASAMQTVLLSGPHNRLFNALISEYFQVVETMLVTKEIPPELQPLYDTVRYCVLGEGEIQLFNDVEKSHWAVKYIEELAIRGVINGVGGRVFEPEENVTREQFVKMMVDAMGWEKSGNEIDFDDADSWAWYYKYVATAYENGLIAGVGGNRFGVGENITRQDMAVILYRAAEMREIEFASDDTMFNKFTDKNNIASYARDAVMLLSGAGIIRGYEDSSFAPHNHLTRAEAARVIYALFYEM